MSYTICVAVFELVVVFSDEKMRGAIRSSCDFQKISCWIPNVLILLSIGGLSRADTYTDITFVIIAYLSKC